MGSKKNSTPQTRDRTRKGPGQVVGTGTQTLLLQRNRRIPAPWRGQGSRTHCPSCAARDARPSNYRRTWGFGMFFCRVSKRSGQKNGSQLRRPEPGRAARIRDTPAQRGDGTTLSDRRSRSPWKTSSMGPTGMGRRRRRPRVGRGARLSGC